MAYQRAAGSIRFVQAHACAVRADVRCLVQPLRTSQAHSKNIAARCKSAVLARRTAAYKRSSTNSLPVLAMMVCRDQRNPHNIPVWE